MQPWKLLKSETAYDGWLKIKKDTYQLPNGERQSYEYIDNIHTAFTLALTREKKFVMIEQFRPSVKATVLEMPGGIVEEGEDPAETAKRELQEEAGYTAEKLMHLGTFYLVPGGASSLVHLYFAEVGERGDATPDHDEFITVKLMSKKELHVLLDTQQRTVRAPLPLALYEAERKGLV